VKKIKAMIEIELDNAAFEDDFSLELSAILQQAASKLVRQRTSVPVTVCAHDKLLDFNGNTVGRCYLVNDDD
jgi:hypothetical protein